MEDAHFHIGILGTGLTESILAAALSKAGYKVVHIDENPHYGADEASLPLDELVKWIDDHCSDSTTSRFRGASRSSSIPPSPRQYAICLRPTIFPSLGPLIISLIQSGVSKYSTFRLLDQVAVYDSSGIFKNVPGSKEDIFKAKEIGLVEKRRLMRFLEFAADDFERSKELEGKHDMPFVQFIRQTFLLKDEIASTIAYSLAYCQTSTDPALPALKRLNVYLRSIGRYGPSPFLVGHYGGVGDIAQGFCRAAAVNGAVYILGRKILGLSQSSEKSDHAISTSTSRHTIELEDVPDTLTCDLLITSTSHIPSNPVLQTSHPSSIHSHPVDSAKAMARCILIFDRAFSSVVNNLLTEELLDGSNRSEENKERLGSAVLIFPPSTVPGDLRIMQQPHLSQGKKRSRRPKITIVYLSLPVNVSTSTESPEIVLAPYVDILCQYSSGFRGEITQPVFKAFYIEYPQCNLVIPKSELFPHLITAALPLFPLPDVADIAAINAKDVFYQAVGALHTINRESENDEGKVQQLWPPLPREEGNDEEAW
ncbi:GDP dissociation inhibitor-domain-containing protein [Cyathus striatus]|nr:GDP dissociation inhibitor-domain-containing protein [Cyathus striatus]